MASAPVPSRFGLIYAGHVFAITELGETTVFISPYSLFPDAVFRQAVFRVGKERGF